MNTLVKNIHRLQYCVLQIYKKKDVCRNDPALTTWTVCFLPETNKDKMNCKQQFCTFQNTINSLLMCGTVTLPQTAVIIYAWNDGQNP